MSSNCSLVTGPGMSSSSICAESCGSAALPLAAAVLRLRGMKTPLVECYASHTKFLTGSLSQTALTLAGVPQFEGSNAWVVSGSRTASGKPLLAGDPHMGYSAPAIWYEAHLSMPGFELYGHHLTLIPNALLGHNSQFGWSLTMFQNDDVDLIAEKVNPANPNQVWYHGQWVELQSRSETILVKDAKPVELTPVSYTHLR